MMAYVRGVVNSLEFQPAMANYAPNDFSPQSNVQQPFLDYNNGIVGSEMSPLDPPKLPADDNFNKVDSWKYDSSVNALFDPSMYHISDEQEVSAEQYLLVNYKFGPGECHGESSSCGCGSDCQCPGCNYHLGGNENQMSHDSLQRTSRI
jgi:hypothetical protein